MDLFTILLIVLVVLCFSGWGYGYYGAYAAGPPAAGPSPLVNVLGLFALILLVATIVLMLTGWRFGVEVLPPH